MRYVAKGDEGGGVEGGGRRAMQLPFFILAFVVVYI